MFYVKFNDFSEARSSLRICGLNFKVLVCVVPHSWKLAIRENLSESFKAGLEKYGFENTTLKIRFSTTNFCIRYCVNQDLCSKYLSELFFCTQNKIFQIFECSTWNLTIFQRQGVVCDIVVTMWRFPTLLDFSFSLKNDSWKPDDFLFWSPNN